MKKDFSKPSGFDMRDGEEMPVAAGVFCDITGTLISYDEKSPDIQTNHDVVAFLRYIRDVRQRSVTLCSRVQENALTPAALHEEFGFVVGKAIYRAQIMEVLIDNNPDEYLHAEHKFGPEALKGFARMTPERQHQLYALLTGDKSPAPTHQRAAFEQ
ncbi:MAG: hypothetical protein IPH06_07915 [Alphaproteobacteria bacterium]|nr:hypothetical protein [Alphaproteobacteria bacterium]QQS57930.1 MAG: hypothetical protein IPN28_03675 [Alphaproteobacteria bacterium]